MPRKKIVPPVTEEIEQPIIVESKTTVTEIVPEEEVMQPVEQTSEPEVVSAEAEVEEDAGVHYVSPEGPAEELHHEEAVAEYSAPPEPVAEILVSDKPRQPLMIPWWAAILGAVIIGLILDSVLAWVGNTWYWSERLLYTVSLVSIFFLCLLQAYLLAARQRMSAKEITIINLVSALLIGSLLSINRFVHLTAFWTFFNLIGQPINAIILSLAASWLGSKLFIKSH